jgi:hypothetical protein
MTAARVPEPGAAMQHLALSRARLIVAWRHDAAAPAMERAAQWAGPGVDLLVAALRARWAQPPWQPAVGAAEVAVRGALRPLAQRHPLALVLAAALAGALLTRARPGRRLWQPALWAAVAPQIVRIVLARRPAAPAQAPPA